MGESEKSRTISLSRIISTHLKPVNRPTTGAEAALIREALASVADMVEDEIVAAADPWEFGVAAFDCLEPSARLAMLAEVGWPLLRDTESFPELTALNEATVAVLFIAIEQLLELEIVSRRDHASDQHGQTNILSLDAEN